MSDKRQKPTWNTTAAAERAAINAYRGRPTDSDADVVGLALSGGGIRSATFSLGVMEGLRECGQLERVDYLSTVSGGGYIGAWLSANCLRNPGWLTETADWRASIGHLRRYSNYLSPAIGFLSADTWSMATIFLRNTLLVQATVILAIACALLVPRPLFELFQHWVHLGHLRWLSVLLFLVGIIGIAGNQMRLTSGERSRTLLEAKSWPLGLAGGSTCLLAAWAFGSAVGFDPFHDETVRYGHTLPVAALLAIGGFLLQPVGVKVVSALSRAEDRPEQINYSQFWVQVAVVVPLMASAFLVGAVLWGEATGGAGTTGLRSLTSYGALVTNAQWYWPFPLSVVFVSFWLLSFWAVSRRTTAADVAAAFLAPAVAVGALHLLLCAVMLVLSGWAADARDGAWKAFVWAPPLVALSFALSIVVLTGMLGRQSIDAVREWWSRLGAWLGIYSAAWMIIAVTAVYAAQWVTGVVNSYPRWSALAGGGWAGTVVAGLLAGGSEDTSGTGRKSWGDRAKEVVAIVAPFLFIAGLLVGVAYVLHHIALINGGLQWSAVEGDSHDKHASFLHVSWAMLAGSTAALVLMAARVDINLFSLNAFYRNRLVRCYLGASRVEPGERTPQNFTGFDETDDVALAALVPDGTLQGPLHIVNCALNLGGSSDLALHTRRSAAFVLSPLHCGSAYRARDLDGNEEELGFVPTSSYGGQSAAPTLGQAISVSGAAASPNMGYHTSPVTAFLLTLFNVRLGRWFPNPSDPAAGSGSPWFSLRYLLAELFGGAHERSRFLMISDGGHFENLAAYELIRRRCRLVIISDAECDPTLTFAGLGTLIRMCAVDFNATIDLKVDAIRRAPDGWSVKRWALGTIIYEDGTQGALLYLKASMTGKENTAVRQYQASHSAFPHESTGDQFYGEDQFESYRQLGREVGVDACRALAAAQRAVGPEPGRGADPPGDAA